MYFLFLLEIVSCKVKKKKKTEGNKGRGKDKTHHVCDQTNFLSLRSYTAKASPRWSSSRQGGEADLGASYLQSFAIAF